MRRMSRFPLVLFVIGGLFASEFSATASAADPSTAANVSPTPQTVSPLRIAIPEQVPAASLGAPLYAQWGHYRGRGRDRSGAAAAIAVGTVAAIAGGAMLFYANRPECSVNAAAGGCSYGTKVASAAVMTGGVVGIIAGSLAWH